MSSPIFVIDSAAIAAWQVLSANLFVGRPPSVINWDMAQKHLALQNLNPAESTLQVFDDPKTRKDDSLRGWLHRTVEERRALGYLVIGHSFLEKENGKRMQPPVRIGRLRVYFTAMLDKLIMQLPIKSGAFPADGAA